QTFIINCFVSHGQELVCIEFSPIGESRGIALEVSHNTELDEDLTFYPSLISERFKIYIKRFQKLLLNNCLPGEDFSECLLQQQPWKFN
ncbi:hypothetical protein PSY31_23060, partial [Shigella flexneri]|nr:hypothetical protein [Shigella flexneri]